MPRETKEQHVRTESLRLRRGLRGSLNGGVSIIAQCTELAHLHVKTAKAPSRRTRLISNLVPKPADRSNNNYITKYFLSARNSAHIISLSPYKAHPEIDIIILNLQRRKLRSQEIR